ncbi:MAG: HAMP domain-containing sensor histidine kinase, partial [Candidatus Omnitrophota bacterium]
ELKTRFVAMASHEIRNPLAAISGGLELLEERSAATISQEQKDFLKVARRNIERLTTLVSELLDFSKNEAGQRRFTFKSHNLNALVEEVVRFRGPEATQAGLSLRMEPDGRLPDFYMDADSILQVLNNLIHNAIKCTPKGEVVVSTTYRKSHAEIAVKDTGCGIEATQMERLFEPFVQIANAQMPRATQRGTGLGLAISKQIVEMHKGRIWAESELGAGSIFKVSLPIRGREDVG